jgi:hypothetical protein
LGFGDIAASYGETIVRQVRYRPCSIDKYLTWASARLDDPWPCAFSTLRASIAEGSDHKVAKDFTAIPYPVGYASCIIVIDLAWSWRRGDALLIAAIRRCLRYATL